MFLSLQLLSIICSSALAAPIKEDKANDYVQIKFIPEELTPGNNFYAMSFQVGSNKQNISLRLDTSSTDFWINSESNELCNAFNLLPMYFDGDDSDVASNWDSFNENLRDQWVDGLASFQASLSSKYDFASLAARPTQSFSSYMSNRENEWNSYLSGQKKTYASKVSSYINEVHGDSSWKSFLTNDLATATEFNISTAVPTVTTKVTNVASGLITTLSSYDGGLFTVAVPTGSLSAKHSSSHKVSTSYDYDFATSATDSVDATDIGEITSEYNQFSDLRLDVSLSDDDFDDGFDDDDYATFSFTSGLSITTTYDFMPNPSATSESDDEFAEIFDAIIYEKQNDCSLYGVFDSSLSDSFKTNDDPFVSEQEFSIGTLGNDTMFLSGVSLENVTFAVVEQSDSNVGVLGIGNSNENSTFKSLPHILKEQGIINSAFYSLQISPFYASVIFGAVDLDGYYSNFTLFPLLNTTDAIALTLSSIKIHYDLYDLDSAETDSVSFQDQTYIIASGKAKAIISTVVNQLYLPNSILTGLVTRLNETYQIDYNDTLGRYTFTTGHNDNNDMSALMMSEIVFDFQGESYNVPISSFITEYESDNELFVNLTNPFNSETGADSSYFDLSSLEDEYLNAAVNNEDISNRDINDSNNNDNDGDNDVDDDNNDDENDGGNDDGNYDDDDDNDSNSGDDDDNDSDNNDNDGDNDVDDDNNDDENDGGDGDSNDDDDDDNDNNNGDDDDGDDDDEGNGTTTFILDILPSQGDEFILGISFLENFVVVVDLDKQQIGLAFSSTENLYDNVDSTTKFGTDKNIAIIEDEIPDSQKVDKYADYYGNGDGILKLNF